jgi:hypothetical protein
LQAVVIKRRPPASTMKHVHAERGQIQLCSLFSECGVANINYRYISDTIRDTLQVSLLAIHVNGTHTVSPILQLVVARALAAN